MSTNHFRIILIVLAIIMCLFFTVSIGNQYRKRSVKGVVIEVYDKGLVFKTLEIEVLRSTPEQIIQISDYHNRRGITKFVGQYCEVFFTQKYYQPFWKGDTYNQLDSIVIVKK